MKTLYTAKVTTVAGRDGHTESDDKKIFLKLSRPGSSESGTNPEQLFAAGYGACFGSALISIAKKKNIEIPDFQMQSEVSLNQEDSGGFFLGVTLNASLPSTDQKVAEQLVKDAHQLCPYSKATRNNVVVKLKANNSDIS